MLAARLAYGPAAAGRKPAAAIAALAAGVALALAAAPGAARADAPVRIVALGDSLVHGYGLPPSDGFVPQLERWLAAEGAAAEVVNAGVSGDTSAGGLARLDWSVGEGADALIVVLGGNDLLRGIDPAVTRANLDALLERAGERGLAVLLAGMEAPMNYGAEYKAAFDALYPELAEAHGALLYPSFLAGVAEDRSLWQADGLHPNADGVAEIVRRIGPLVLELAERARSG